MSRMADFYIVQDEAVERVANNLRVHSDFAVFDPETLVRSIRASIKTLQGVLSNLDSGNEIQFECGECGGKKYTLDDGRVAVYPNGFIEFFCWEHE